MRIDADQAAVDDVAIFVSVCCVGSCFQLTSPAERRIREGESASTALADLADLVDMDASTLDIVRFHVIPANSRIDGTFARFETCVHDVDLMSEKRPSTTEPG